MTADFGLTLTGHLEGEHRPKPKGVARRVHIAVVLPTTGAHPGSYREAAQSGRTREGQTRTTMSHQIPSEHGYPSQVLGGNIPADHLPDTPGEWQLRGNSDTVKHLFFGCRHPDPLKTAEWPRCSVPIKPPQPNGWDFDGNLDAPTLHPSIDCKAPGCGWHGHCKAGVFTP